MRLTRGTLTVSLLLGMLAAPAAAQQTAVSLVSARGTGLAESDLAAIRAATDKYRDLSVALAEGYVQHPMCVTAADEGAPKQLGAMGYHYFRPDLLGITAEAPRVAGNGMHEDFEQPSLLLYEPQADGSMKLTAIENLIWAKPWAEAGHETPPSFAGQEYYYIHDNPETPIDEAHGFVPHYELHFWLYRENPAGAFSPFNTAVSCEHAMAHGEH